MNRTPLSATPLAATSCQPLADRLELHREALADRGAHEVRVPLILTGVKRPCGERQFTTAPHAAGLPYWI
jgi:hypothetical protein